MSAREGLREGLVLSLFLEAVLIFFLVVLFTTTRSAWVAAFEAEAKMLRELSAELARCYPSPPPVIAPRPQ